MSTDQTNALAPARVIRDDAWAAQDVLDYVLSAGSTYSGLHVPTGLATERDYYDLAALIPAEDDEAWRDIAGARRRVAVFLDRLASGRSADLDEAAKLHAVLNVARQKLGVVAGLDYRPHCDRT